MVDEWIRGLIPGEFRGVQFFIKRHSYTGGRALVKHEFPEVDGAQYEDQGKLPGSFSMSIYVLGGNYFQHREAMIAALETEGPGLLNHPYRGIFNVRVDGFTVSEGVGRGRTADFEVNFDVEEIDTLTKVDPNPQGLAFEAKQSLLDSILEWFADAYDLASTPITAIEDLTATIDSAFEVVDAAKKLANTTAEFKASIRNLKGKGIALTLNASLLASQMIDTINFGTNLSSPVNDLVATADNAKDQTRELYAIAEASVDSFTPTPPDIADDPDYPAYQVRQMMIYSAIGGLVGMTTVENFSSVEDAETAKIKLFDLIDTVSESGFIADDIYEDLRDAKAAINEDLTVRSITLPRIIEFQNTYISDSLSLSNTIYGTIAGEQDIIDRNKIIHPGFISAVVPIKVRSIE